MTESRSPLTAASVILAALALAGCGTEPCPANDDLQVLAACAIPEAGWNGAGPMDGEGVDVSWVGTVAETGIGDVPADCMSGGHVGGDGSRANWARITEADTGDSWIVAFAVPDATGTIFPPVGQDVQIEYSFAFGGFSPDIGHLTVRDAAGELALWVGAAGGIDSITTPAELTLAKGSPRCTDRDSCGDWQELDLSVTVNGGPDGGLDVAYGATEFISGFRFHHGGYAETTRYSNNCADWFVADLDAALAWDVSR